MESHHFNTFIEVARTGSFSEAAERLCIPQSVVIRRILQMEKYYESPLFDLTGSSLKQTDKGKTLMQKALKIMELERELTVDINCTGANNRIAFTCTPTFSAAFLPQILREFSSRTSRSLQYCFCRDMPDQIRLQLRRGDFDLAVIEHCPGFDLAGFKTVALPDDELVFVSADTNVPARIEHVKKLLWSSLLCCDIGCCTRVILENNLTRQNTSVGQFENIIECSDLDMLLQSLLAGMGIAFLPRILIESYLKNGRLKEFQVRDFDHFRKRSLVFSPAANGVDVTREFAAQIVEYFSA